MPVQLKLHLPSPGEPMIISRVLGISAERKTELEFHVKAVCERAKGSYIDDFKYFAQIADNIEEYGVTTGANLAMSNLRGKN